MIETQSQHAFPNHDPTGLEEEVWPRRLSTQERFSNSLQSSEEPRPPTRPNDNAKTAEELERPRHSHTVVESNPTENKKSTIVANPSLAARQSDVSHTGFEGGNMERRQSQPSSSINSESEKDKVLKLSPAQIQELTSSPESIPIRLSQDKPTIHQSINSPAGMSFKSVNEEEIINRSRTDNDAFQHDETNIGLEPPMGLAKGTGYTSPAQILSRPTPLGRTVSTPATARTKHPRDDISFRAMKQNRNALPPLSFEPNTESRSKASPTGPEQPSSPLPSSIPLPPLSLPTYLQLELASTRPSPLYIHRPGTSDFPYESSRVKLERLQNFLLLPLHLEQVLFFGTVACLDAWLYTFTILPLRFLKALSILSRSWALNVITETQFVLGFIYQGSGRMWERRKSRGASVSGRPAKDNVPIEDPFQDKIPSGSGGRGESRRPTLSERPSEQSRVPKFSKKHKRSRSIPSNLLPDDKADILKGLLIIATCAILMRFNASRMYHWIRQQAAIKLYVIYNVLEVSDRLFSAIGQDVLECLFSREALERRPDGRSKVLRPFWLFIAALIYTVIHATSLFYQVITLNVAVNSYNNALITLLMSNQFVEIKSTVFKKFEKDNLFQLTCADVVERFQLWLMLVIIASRNIVETGGLSTGFILFTSTSSASVPSATNSSSANSFTPPRSSSSILPSSFEIIPSLFTSMTAYAPTVVHVLGPFIVVLGSEMVIDWLKHAYVNKFNNTRPIIYSRFLDVLAKDYYTNAFADQNLTKRLGLPVIPLSCLFIRAGVQTYDMFMAAWVPAPLPSAATSLTSVHLTSMSSPHAPSTTAAISQQIDALFRRLPAAISSSTAFKAMTTIMICLLIYLVLLALKLVLGMVLLSFSRARYRSMKQHEKTAPPHVEGGRRVGGWGVVEVDEDKKRWIYEDDPAGSKALRERDEKEKERMAKGSEAKDFERVKRYEMVAKRIW